MGRSTRETSTPPLLPQAADGEAERTVVVEDLEASMEIRFDPESGRGGGRWPPGPEVADAPDVLEVFADDASGIGKAVQEAIRSKFEGRRQLLACGHRLAHRRGMGEKLYRRSILERDFEDVTERVYFDGAAIGLSVAKGRPFG